MRRLESHEDLLIPDDYGKVQKNVLPFVNLTETSTGVSIQPPPSCEKLKEHKCVKGQVGKCESYVEEKKEKKKTISKTLANGSISCQKFCEWRNGCVDRIA